jgi:hypothetical protein
MSLTRISIIAFKLKDLRRSAAVYPDVIGNAENAIEQWERGSRG